MKTKQKSILKKKEKKEKEGNGFNNPGKGELVYML